MTEHHVATKTFGRYIILHTIGKGEFGKVKLAYDPQKEIEVAIKFIKRSNITSAQKQAKLEREINILQNLDHPNIVRLFDVIETEKYIGIVMAYANGGELFEYISENQYLSEEESAKFFIQLLDGVQYLHSRHIVHRDLKLENLLLDQKGDIIITDFGFANNSRKNPSGLLSTSCGSPCYAAPELVINDNYIGEAADIWSCGIILYAMLCGYLPFDDDPNNPDGENLDLLYKYILESQLTFPDYVSEDAQELVCGMLIPDPEKRWSMDKVINHRWLRNSSYGRKRINESMKLGYMYDNSYLEGSNSEIESAQEGKVPEYPPKVPQNNNDETEHTEVYDARNASCSENVDISLDKTEYIQNQDASKDAVVPNETNNVIVDSVVPEVEKQQSISQTSSEQEFLDAQQELSMEVTKDQDNDPMDVEDDPMEIDETLNNKEDQRKIEKERQIAEKQIEKLINEIQQEEFAPLEEMKDQLQEVVAEKAEEHISPKETVLDMVEEVNVSEVVVETEKIEKAKEEIANSETVEEVKEEIIVPETVTEKVEEAKEEVTVPETVTEKVEVAKEEVTVPETVTEKVEVAKEEVTVPETVTEKVEVAMEEVTVPETVTEKVEETKEEVTVPETVTEKVEETKEEVTVPEPVTEKVEETKEEETKEEVTVPESANEKVEVKEEVASVPEVAIIEVEEIKEDKVRDEDKVESPSTIKLEKEDLIEVDDEVKDNSSNSTIETEKESVKVKEEKTDVEEEQVKSDNITEDVEMKEQDDSKESEITTMEEEVGMLRKRKQKKDKKDKMKIKKGKKEIRKNEKAKNKKNIKVKIKENKMFRVFFGCVMKDPATKEH
ncbi:Pkinase-domain-containing protein [Neocallimastix lanati (nom. inval.)]|nr:Pkinase-domain-containing protein [Neocallimastix sp. JGI-2020a]